MTVVTEEPRHLVNVEDGGVGKDGSRTGERLCRVGAFQPIDGDDGLSRAPHPFLQWFPPSTDRAQQFGRRGEAAVLRLRRGSPAARVDPQQHRKRLAQIVDVDIGAQHHGAFAEAGDRGKSDLAFAERIDRQRRAEKARGQIPLQFVAKLDAGALDDGRTKADLRPLGGVAFIAQHRDPLLVDARQAVDGDLARHVRTGVLGLAARRGAGSPPQIEPTPLIARGGLRARRAWPRGPNCRRRPQRARC